MSRRRFLQTAASVGIVGLAGCSAVSLFDDDPPLKRQVSLVSVDPVPQKYPCKINVKLPVKTVNRKHTAQIQIVITNTGEKQGYSIVEEFGMFDSTDGASEPPGLWIYYEDRHEGLEREDKRWERPLPPDRGQAYPGIGVGMTLSKDESVSTMYYLWDNYQVDRYMPEGTYRFEAPLSASDREEPLIWGFSIALDVPDSVKSSGN